MNISCVAFGSLFLVAGLLFGKGKLHGHLAAWKAMAPEEKAKIDIIPLCRNIGGVIALSGLIFLAKGVTTLLSDGLFVGAMVAWFILAGIDVWYISSGKRYYREG